MKSLPSMIRRLMYLTVSKMSMRSQIQNDVIILCYHSVSDDGWRFSISFDNLKKQIDYIKTVRSPISLEDLELYLQGKIQIKKPSFIVTFDDGYKNVLKGVEYFQKMQIKPALFVLSDPEHADHTALGNSLQFLNDDEIKLLKKSGWTIGVHSATHQDFNKLDERAITAEIKDSKKFLEKSLDFQLSYFSYPKGFYSKPIIDMVKESGYTMAVSMDDGVITEATDKFIVPRIGVDATHSFEEFKVLFSPSVIWLRGLLKKTPVSRFFTS